jgi:hypothetical protein
MESNGADNYGKHRQSQDGDARRSERRTNGLRH